MERDIIVFSYKGNLIFVFSHGVNLRRGHELSRLVLRTWFRGDETI